MTVKSLRTAIDVGAVASAFPLRLNRKGLKEGSLERWGNIFMIGRSGIYFSDSEAFGSGDFYSDRSPADSIEIIEMFLFSSDEVCSGGACSPMLLPAQGLSPSVVLMC